MSASRLKQSTKRHNANISMAYGCDKDNNTYAYRMIGGSKVFQRVQLGPGWQDQRFSPNCEIEKGEGSMREAPDKEVLLALYKKHNGKIDLIRKELRVNWVRAKKWLIQAGIIDSYGNPIAQAEPGGDQPDPAQDEGKSAETIIPKREHFEGDCPKCGTKPYGIKGDIKLIKWIADNGEEMCYECYLKTLTEDKHEPTYTAPLMGDTKPLTFEGSFFNPETPAEPQRKTYTAAQYEADVKSGTYPLTGDMLNDIADDRRSALSLYCERQAEAAMIQGWVIDIFKHHQLSRERKLELIGMLLDWEAE